MLETTGDDGRLRTHRRRTRRPCGRRRPHPSSVARSAPRSTSRLRAPSTAALREATCRTTSAPSSMRFALAIFGQRLAPSDDQIIFRIRANTDSDGSDGGTDSPDKLLNTGGVQRAQQSKGRSSPTGGGEGKGREGRRSGPRARTTRDTEAVRRHGPPRPLPGAARAHHIFARRRDPARAARPWVRLGPRPERLRLRRDRRRRDTGRRRPIPTRRDQRAPRPPCGTSSVPTPRFSRLPRLAPRLRRGTRVAHARPRPRPACILLVIIFDVADLGLGGFIFALRFAFVAAAAADCRRLAFGGAFGFLLL